MPLPDDAIPLNPGLPPDAVALPPHRPLPETTEMPTAPYVASRIPTLPGVPPGLGSQALIAGEQFIGEPLAISTGIATGGALTGMATANPIAAILGASTGGAMAGAGSRATFEGINRLLGFPPREMNLGEAAAEGFMVVPTEKVLGAVGKGVMGITQRNIAERTTRDVAEEVIPRMKNEIQIAANDMQDKVLGVHAHERREAEKKLRQIRTEEKKRLGVEKARAREQFVGMTPQEVAERRTAMGAELESGAERRKATVGVVQDAQQAGQNKLGAQFEAAYAPKAKNELEDVTKDALSQKASAILDKQQEFGQVDSALQGLLNRVRGPSEEVKAAARKEAIQNIVGKGGAIPIALPPPGAKLQREELKALQAQLEAAKTSSAEVTYESLSPDQKVLVDKEVNEKLSAYNTPKTVGDLLQIQADAGKAMNTSHGPSRHTAAELRASVLDALDASGVVVDPKLKAQYHLWRRIWDWPSLRNIYNAVGPVDLDKVFTPENLGSLLPNIGAPEKAMLKETLQEWAVANHKSLDAIAAVVSDKTARELGMPSISQWQKLDIDAVANQKAAAAQPRIAAEQQRGVAEGVARAQQAMDLKKRASITKMLKQLGEPARPLLKQVLNMSPEDAATFYQTTIDNPTFLPDVLQMARDGVFHKGNVMGTLKQHGKFVLMIAAGEMMTRGHVSTYIAGAGPMLVGGAALGWLRSAMLEGLTTTGALTKLENLIKGPPTPTRARKIGRFLGDFLVANAIRYPDAAARVATVGEPVPVPLPFLQQPQPTPTPGPGA